MMTDRKPDTESHHLRFYDQHDKEKLTRVFLLGPDFLTQTGRLTVLRVVKRRNRAGVYL